MPCFFWEEGPDKGPVIILKCCNLFVPVLIIALVLVGLVPATARVPADRDTTFSPAGQVTFLYLPKTDYRSGEPIEISGSTPLPAGTHLYISVYTLRYHQKTKPEGKTTFLSKEIVVENSSDKSDRNFYVCFNSTALLPGDYYTVVDNLDAGSDEESTLNRTSVVFTLDNPPVSTQSGTPLPVAVGTAAVAVCLVFLGRRTG